MYLEYFELKEYPFTLTPNVDYFFRFLSHQEALNVLMVGIQNGEGFMAITGEVGSGKTLMCRKLLEICDRKEIVTAYIPNPNLDAVGVYRSLAQELEIDLLDYEENPQRILHAVQKRLIDLYKSEKKVLFIIDEAQVMSNESLEALRLLSNLETKSDKLLQIVLFAQPELNKRLKKNDLRQLRQRITFSYNLRPIADRELKAYLEHRMKIASEEGIKIKFSRSAYYLLRKASGGIPRLINLLCHKSLLIAYGLGAHKINSRIMLLAIKDTGSSSKKYVFYYILNFLMVFLSLIAIAEIAYFIWMHL